MMTVYDESLAMHEKHRGKLEVKSKVPLKDRKDLSLAYTPGVAEPCRRIAANKEDVYKYTMKGNSVAVVSDGTAVLGLGNIGGYAAIPVMEGKAVLFKELGGIDAFPICLASQDVKTTIETVRNIAPVFGGINLEDFKAPQCFEIEAALQDLGIPVMHDDQHGTAVVALAGLINALKVVRKEMKDVRIVFNGAGAAGTAVMKLMIEEGANDIIMCDTKGIIVEGRADLPSNPAKVEIAKLTNRKKIKGQLTDAIKGADVFIGVSVKGALTQDMVKLMAKNPVIFALANPDPEILPDEAKAAGAAVIATGRSDFPNQVNNSLGFPGIFRGALDVRATRITTKMKIAAAKALAGLIKNPTPDMILPLALDKSVPPAVAEAVKKAWIDEMR
jgi:malate dehydrogenase (oxaloacetate-decarboxylating)